MKGNKEGRIEIQIEGEKDIKRKEGARERERREEEGKRERR
jgi:hypothetical protein